MEDASLIMVWRLRRWDVWVRSMSSNRLLYMLGGAMPLQAPRRQREMAGGWLAVGAKDASGMVVWRPATLQEDGQRAAAARTRNHRLMGGLQKGIGEGEGNLVAPRQFFARKQLNGNFDPRTWKKATKRIEKTLKKFFFSRYSGVLGRSTERHLAIFANFRPFLKFLKSIFQLRPPYKGS
jgi:hypothetical protein